jgi:hypothetical protein
MGMIIGPSVTPLNFSGTWRAVRRRETVRSDDNSRRQVQTVRGDSSDAHVALEELTLCDKGPRPQHAAEEVVRRIGNESVGFERHGRMLHRPPPLIRILRPPSLVRSMTVTEDRSEAYIAAMIPAAPPPTTAVAGNDGRAQGDYLPPGNR